jgi:hypothetical protein
MLSLDRKEHTMTQITNKVLSLLMAGLASSAIIAFTTAASAAAAPDNWSRGVIRICAHALLFEGSHEIGTRAGAVAVADDIRASTERRLTRVAAMPAPPTQRALAARWIGVERRLATVYATSYLGIFDVIAAAETPEQQTQAASLLGKLLHAPDRLSQTAAGLEQHLQVPDCTGGTARPTPSSPSADPTATTRR